MTDMIDIRGRRAHTMGDICENVARDPLSWCGIKSISFSSFPCSFLSSSPLISPLISPFISLVSDPIGAAPPSSLACSLARALAPILGFVCRTDGAGCLLPSGE